MEVLLGMDVLSVDADKVVVQDNVAITPSGNLVEPVVLASDMTIWSAGM